MKESKMKKILIKLRNLVNTLMLYPAVLLMKKQDPIYCECYLSKWPHKFKKNNWGDDLNMYMFEFVTGRRVVNIGYSKVFPLRKIKVYSLIGSIITFYQMENKIIYGSGIMNPKSRVRGTPQKIISVRGPKTRDVLVSNGIDCPKSFGDPALLLPVFYFPKVSKKKGGSVIANMGTTESNKKIEDLCKALNLKIISMTNYDKWTDVIDEIISSEFIISESLHGLIVAETYGIPNVWVEFVEHPSYWNFKFEDYFASIGKEEAIIRIQERIEIDSIKYKVDNWEKGHIDYKSLISIFPFNIKCDINGSLLN